MDNNFKDLELDKILNKVASFALSDEGKTFIYNLTPSNNLNNVKYLLAQTSDAYRLMAGYGAPSLSGIVNISGLLKRAETGGALSMGELLSVANILSIISEVLRWKESCSGVDTILNNQFKDLTENKYLEDKIKSCILSDSEMSDNASTELRDIRRKKRNKESTIREKLEQIVRSPAYRDILQETIITERNGRFVVPVKSERRSDIIGMVHDTSSSGGTLFIEPSSVIEANNEIRVLEGKECKEIERILSELSDEVGDFSPSISKSYKVLVELDVIFAKARYAYEENATEPVLNDSGVIKLISARHPLIDKKIAVPIDVNLGQDYNVLVITGPNTGGKTVSIKTIGLLTLMVECGLFITANEKSEISVFDFVFSDIDDRQSIEQSLSTFSAHMKNVVSIIEKADSKSLVLIDELGSGTDPIEGSAIAVSILDCLRARGVKMAATTHYPELKEYALRTQGVENASCEFSIETLKPTYKLITGIPGKSNAFAISKRLGLPSMILENAKKLISENNNRFEEVLSELQNTKSKIEIEKIEIVKNRQELLNLKIKAEEYLKNSEKVYDEKLKEARRDADNILKNSRRAANSLMLELERLKKEQQSDINAAESLKKAKAQLKSNLNEVYDLTYRNKFVYSDDEQYELPRPLKKGDIIYLIKLDMQAEVISVDGSSVNASAGLIKVRADIKDIRLLKEKKKEKIKTLGTRRIRQEKIVESISKSSVDIRGEDTISGISLMDNYLDKAIRAGYDEVTVIHGKGTGKLKQAVRTHLKNHPLIKSFRPGVYGEGEDGVTIVILK